LRRTIEFEKEIRASSIQTQRIHAHLKEAFLSRHSPPMIAILACAGWFASLSFPLTAQTRPLGSTAQIQRRSASTTSESLPYAPVPPDTHEPVTGSVQPLATPADRSNALALMDRAMQNSKMHLAGGPPYQMVANFVASGNGAYVGPGTLTETWLSGQRWRWTENIGSFTTVRNGSNGWSFAEPPVATLPMPVHVLRNAIFWAGQDPPANAQMRTAAIQWNGRPATCLLTSGVVASGLPVAGNARSWGEQEYCIDNASGLLLVRSIVPGTYVEFNYSGVPFHGRSVPDRITLYVAGSKVLDAQIGMTDPDSDPSLFAPTPQMSPETPQGLPTLIGMTVPTAGISEMIKPVVVHASIDGQGRVAEVELSSASDPALAQSALDLVKNNRLPPTGATRQVYVTVRFGPELR
jgi:hypothetical protein